MDKQYSIREVSAKFNLPASTLRYYEEVGILTDIPRNSSGKRIYLEKHINKGYNVTILPKVIESTYLDDFQYLDSNVKIETLLENSIDLINYRKGKLDWIFKEYIRLSNKYSLV